MAVSGRRLQGGNPSCDLCDDGKADLKFCLQCSQYMCPACLSRHKRSTVSRNHEPISTHDIPQQLLELDYTIFCTSHENRNMICSDFCHDHNKLFCHNCQNQDAHKDCKTQSMSKLSEEFYGSNHYEAILKNIEDLNQKVDDSENSSYRNRDILKTSLDKCSSDIQIFFEDIKKELDDAMDDLKKNEESETASYSEQKNELKSMEQFLTYLKAHNLYERLVLAAKKSETKIKQIEEKVEQIKKDNNQFNRSFGLEKDFDVQEDNFSLDFRDIMRRSSGSLSNKTCPLCSCQDISSAQLDVASTQLDVSSAQQDASSAKLDVSSAQLDVSSAQLDVSSTQQNTSNSYYTGIPCYLIAFAVLCIFIGNLLLKT